MRQTTRMSIWLSFLLLKMVRCSRVKGIQKKVVAIISKKMR
jgi:hypothetical protein